MAGAKIPTPLVLTLASAMVCVGLVAAFGGPLFGVEETRGDAPEPASVEVDTSTAERAAESFLDAWRKREHALALELSVGAAHEAAESRLDADLELNEEDQRIRAVWDSLAQTRLTLRIEVAEDIETDRVLLQTVAQGRFLDRPYEREIIFIVKRIGDDWRVEDMQLGRNLTESPDVLTMPRVHDDPGIIAPRGQDVP